MCLENVDACIEMFVRMSVLSCKDYNREAGLLGVDSILKWLFCCLHVHIEYIILKILYSEGTKRTFSFDHFLQCIVSAVCCCTSYLG